MPLPLTNLLTTMDVFGARVNSGLWQNAAKTTPALVDGDLVRVLTCPHTGVDNVCSSDGVRATLRQSGGVWWLEHATNVTSLYQYTAGAAPTNPFFVCAVRCTAASPNTTWSPVVIGSTTGTRENVSLGAVSNTSARLIYPGPTGITGATVAGLNGRDAVFTGSAGASGLQLWDGGSSVGTNATSPYAGNAVIRPANRWEGRLYFAATWSDTLSSGDRADAEAFALGRINGSVQIPVFAHHYRMQGSQ